MSHYYAAISALIFTLVTLGHLIRLLRQWTIQIGPLSVPMCLMGRPYSCSLDGNLGLHAVRPMNNHSNVPSMPLRGTR